MLRSLICLFLLSTITWSEESLAQAISESQLEIAKPHLLPNDHPLPDRTPSNALIARHDKLKGFLVKIYLDNQPIDEEWHQWLKRIHSANMIRNLIEKREYGHLFKAPRKWIYLIPNRSKRCTLLIVEDMQLVPYDTNLKMWKKAITPEHLDSLYDLLQSLGLLDSVYVDNAAFSKDKKISFVDTEHSLLWPVPFWKLNGRLSPAMKTYWKGITGQ